MPDFIGRFTGGTPVTSDRTPEGSTVHGWAGPVVSDKCNDSYGDYHPRSRWSKWCKMKIISILCICSLLCACGIENIDKSSLGGAADYMRPGDNVKDVEAMLDKCGQQKLISMYYGPPNAYMNQLFKMMYCMEDHGFHLSDSSARQGCRNNLPDRYPVCEARGAYK